jgi:hypothetical protein
MFDSLNRWSGKDQRIFERLEDEAKAEAAVLRTESFAGLNSKDFSALNLGCVPNRKPTTQTDPVSCLLVYSSRSPFGRARDMNTVFTAPRAETA